MDIPQQNTIYLAQGAMYEAIHLLKHFNRSLNSEQVDTSIRTLDRARNELEAMVVAARRGGG